MFRKESPLHLCDELQHVGHVAVSSEQPWESEPPELDGCVNGDRFDGKLLLGTNLEFPDADKNAMVFPVLSRIRRKEVKKTLGEAAQKSHANGSNNAKVKPPPSAPKPSRFIQRGENGAFVPNMARRTGLRIILRRKREALPRELQPVANLLNAISPWFVKCIRRSFSLAMSARRMMRRTVLFVRERYGTLSQA